MAATNSNPNNQDEYGMAEKIRDGVVNMVLCQDLVQIKMRSSAC